MREKSRVCHQLPEFCAVPISRGGRGGQRIGGGGLDEIPGKTALLGEADARNEGDKIRTNKVVDPNTEDIDSRALNDDAS